MGVISKKDVSIPLKARMKHYCSNCGDEWSDAPTHGCFITSVDPRSPFCIHCGKTLRAGFIESVTCQCYR